MGRRRRIKLYVMPGSLGGLCKPSQRQTYAGGSEGMQQHDTVMLKDLEETNSWARLGFELHFRWFTLLLEINAVATAWIIFTREETYSYKTLVCFLLIVLNLVGLLATALVIKYELDCNRRIQGVSDRLARFYQSKDPFSKPLSQVPRQAAMLLFGSAGFVMVLLLIVWAILLGRL